MLQCRFFCLFKNVFFLEKMFHGSHTVTNKIVFKSRRWCISTGSPLMNLILGSDESSRSLRLLAIYLLYTYCLDCTALPLDEWTPLSVLSPLKRSTSAVALSTNSSSDKQHAADMRDGNERRILPCWAFKGRDVAIEEVERGSRTSFHIPPSLCSVILPCSVVALLIASRFSKGRSMSSGSVPLLCLILFRTLL